VPDAWRRRWGAAGESQRMEARRLFPREHRIATTHRRSGASSSPVDRDHRMTAHLHLPRSASTISVIRKSVLHRSKGFREPRAYSFERASRVSLLDDFVRRRRTSSGGLPLQLWAINDQVHRGKECRYLLNGPPPTRPAWREDVRTRRRLSIPISLADQAWQFRLRH
jgi:hypothetical protein